VERDAEEALLMRSGKKSQSVLVLAAAGLGALFLGFPLALRAFVLEAFKIPSASMEPALLIGDHIFVDKLPFHRATVTRGEVILFPFPENPEQDFVKRVIALPGDTLLVKNGHPWINGWEIPHCVVGTGQLPPSEGLTPSGEVDVEYLDGTAYLVFFDVASLGGLSVGAGRQPQREP
jgi:signal peptidase I